MKIGGTCTTVPQTISFKLTTTYKNTSPVLESTTGDITLTLKSCETIDVTVSTTGYPLIPSGLTNI